MGILDRIGAFKPSPVTGQPQSGGLLTGMAPAEAVFARNLGGLLGRDMRTPQEKLQAELIQVKNPLSAEGMLQRAQIIASNSTDPQSLRVAAALATEARNLKKAQTDKERAEKAREGDLKFLEENEEYKQYVDDYESFSVGSEFVAKLRQEKVAEEAAKRAAGLSKKQRTRVYTTLGKLYGVPEKDQTAIEAGDFSDMQSEDFKKLFKPENQKAETVNFEVALDPVGFATTGETGGTVVRAYSQRQDGKVLDPKDRKWKEISEIGVVRKTQAVEKEKGQAPKKEKTGEALKTSLLSVAQDAYTAMAQTLSGTTMERLATGVLAAAGLPTEKSNKLNQQQRVLVTTMGRGLSGAAIPKDERPEWRELTTPTLRELVTPEALVIKMASNQYIIDKAVEKVEGTQELTSEAIAFTAQGAKAAVDEANDVMSRPFSEEELKAIEEGRIDDAVSLRLYGKLAREAERQEDEITIESLRAKYPS